MFCEVKGHRRQINTLIGNIKNNRLAGAYLFFGPEGIGKRMVALNMARFIYCSAAQNDDCCGQCPSCKRIDKNIHPDLFILKGDASSKIKIDDIREIEKKSALRPYEGRYKIFIVDGAEAMTIDAANALLKRLEEPQEQTVFVLIAKQEAALLPTVVSRCRRIRFNALSIGAIKQILMQGNRLGEEQAHCIAYFSQGRVSSALALGREKVLLKEKDRAWEDLLSRRISFRDRQDARRRLNLFLLWLRDLRLAQLGCPARMLINIDREKQIYNCRDSWSPRRLDAGIVFVFRALSYLEQNINLRLLANLVKVKLCKE